MTDKQNYYMMKYIEQTPSLLKHAETKMSKLSMDIEDEIISGHPLV